MDVDPDVLVISTDEDWEVVMVDAEVELEVIEVELGVVEMTLVVEKLFEEFVEAEDSDD